MAGTAAKKTTAAKKAAAEPTKDDAAPKADAAITTTKDEDKASDAELGKNTPPTEKQVEKARAGAEDKSKVDSDGYPVGDHLGGTGVQDAAAQVIENVKGHDDAPVTQATTARQSRTALGDNPEADARAENPTPPDTGSVNVAGHQPYAPVAAPLDRPRNPVYTPENIDPETQVGRDDHEPVHAAAVAPTAVRDGSRLVDDDGNDVAISSVFAESNGPENFRKVQKRVHIESPLPGSRDQTTRHLFFPVDAKVNVDTVARLQREWA